MAAYAKTVEHMFGENKVLDWFIKVAAAEQDRLDLNFPQNNSITPHLIEFHISTSLSLFRLWLQRQQDLSPEEFFKLVDNLYTKGVTPYSK